VLRVAQQWMHRVLCMLSAAVRFVVRCMLHAAVCMS
jgi:hypothetical protein